MSVRNTNLAHQQLEDRERSIFLKPVPNWPSDRSKDWAEVTAVAVDSKDRVYAFARDPNRILIFKQDGTLCGTFGDDLFKRPHGLTIDRHDNLYCTDDLDHTVKIFSPTGELQQTLGTSGVPSATGATSVDYRTIQREAGPFHFPTNVAISADGTIAVADGYGNARIHLFSPQGRLLNSWGKPGSGPGQFHIPHGIAFDIHDRLYVADRENDRIQKFSLDGTYLGEIDNVARPCQIAFDDHNNLYVAELGYRAGMWPGTVAPEQNAVGGRVTVYNQQEQVIARLGGGDNPTAVGDFFAPHDLCLDSHGSLYVAEVIASAGGRRGLVPLDCHAIQKFQRISDPIFTP